MKKHQLPSKLESDTFFGAAVPSATNCSQLVSAAYLSLLAYPPSLAHSQRDPWHRSLWIILPDVFHGLTTQTEVQCDEINES